MKIDLELYLDKISKLEKLDDELGIVKNLPVTGVFDSFYYIFLLIFENEIWKVLKLKRDFDIDKMKVIESAVLSLKQELVGIAAKTLIYEIHDAKEQNLLPEVSDNEQYAFYDELFMDIKNVRELLTKYPVLRDIILRKLETKIELLEQFLANLEYSRERIQSEFNIQVKYLNDIIWGTGGDSHNNGKSVLVFVVNKDKKMVYKPHSLQPDLQLEQFYAWINNHTEIQTKMHICKTIDCGSYGWQEFVIANECKSEDEVLEYYYRIGVLICLFYTIGTQDIHCENLILHNGMPIVIDNESLLSNILVPENDDNLVGVYCETLKRYVYSSIIIPQNIQGTLFDIDLSVLGERSTEKSQKLKGVAIVETGTSNIQMKEVFATSGDLNQRKATVFFEGREISAADYLDYIIKGFENTYQILIDEKHDFMKILYKKENLNRKYRQILRATYVYYKFLDASRHPKYLKDKAEYNRLLQLIGKNKIANNVQIVEAEVLALKNNDIPYFYTYPDSHNLYYISEGQELVIENVFEKTIDELILLNVNHLSVDDMKRQIRFIKMSFANQKMKKPLNGNFLKKDCIEYKSNTDLYLSLAIQIGDQILENLIYNKSKTEAAIIGLNVNDKCNLVTGCAGATLYDGMGIILFLSYLYKVTTNDKYKNAAFSLLNGMESLALPIKNVSAFLGKGSYLYTYYLMYKIFNEERFYNKSVEIVNSMDEQGLLESQRLDVIDGLAGTIIVIINIYKECKNPKFLSIANNMGEMLFAKVENGEMPIMTGMAHGYAGLIYAFTLLAQYSGTQKYKHIASKLIQSENQKKNDNESNWLDLRQEDGSETQNYWCHGAPGIILSRLKCFENTNDIEMRSIIKADIQGSLVNLTRYELINEKDCLCHGFWGNIDILVSLGVYDAGILKLAKQYANKHIQSILQNGFDFANDNNEEVYNFMLGISGVGYALLRLIDIDMPSVLALEI